MLLVDDFLLAPFRGLLWVFEKIHDAAQEEIAGEADAVALELRELYMMLETGRITEAEFGDREGALLDRLDAIEERRSEGEDENSEPDEEEGANDTEEDEDGKDNEDT